jgi:hypothetical protein
MTTLRQIEANQRNAQRSTGPRTEEGKEQSRRNALTHGMTGAGIVLAEDVEEAIHERFEQWAQEFGPATPYQRFLVEQIALNSVRLEQCSRQEIYERGQLSLRASCCWYDDRKLVAEQLAQGLARRPALVAKQLERTVQGCDWLLERWEALGRILARNGDWSAAERSLALDLLGTPADLRDDTSRLVDGLNEVVRNQVERLNARREDLVVLDEREREQTYLGRSVEPDARLVKTRRYEAQIRRSLQWSMAQYFRVTLGVGLSSPTLGFPVPAEAEADTEPETTPEPEPEPEEAMARGASMGAPIDTTLRAEPDRFDTLDAEVAIGPLAPDHAPRPAPRLVSSSGFLASALAPTPAGNRRARRARARRA